MRTRYFVFKKEDFCKEDYCLLMQASKDNDMAAAFRSYSKDDKRVLVGCLVMRHGRVETYDVCEVLRGFKICSLPKTVNYDGFEWMENYLHESKAVDISPVFTNGSEHPFTNVKERLDFDCEVESSSQNSNEGKT